MVYAINLIPKLQPFKGETKFIEDENFLLINSCGNDRGLLTHQFIAFHNDFYKVSLAQVIKMLFPMNNVSS